MKNETMTLETLLKQITPLPDCPTIEVRIPDYDTSFTYQLVFGEICQFSDNNLLDLSHRAELTDLVSVVNARLLELNRLRRQIAILPELVQALEELNCWLIAPDTSPEILAEMKIKCAYALTRAKAWKA